MKQHLLKTIDELDLSTRSYNGLRRTKIDTVKQLVEVTEDYILCYGRGLGVKSIKEIREKLKILGLSLKE